MIWEVLSSCSRENDPRPLVPSAQKDPFFSKGLDPFNPHTPGPSTGEPIPQRPLKTTKFEGPKTIETLRVGQVSAGLSDGTSSHHEGIPNDGAFICAIMITQHLYLWVKTNGTILGQVHHPILSILVGIRIFTQSFCWGIYTRFDLSVFLSRSQTVNCPLGK